MLDHGAKWIRNSQGVTCCFTVITWLNFDLQRPNMAIHSVTLIVSQVEITIIALFNDKSFPWQRTFNSGMWDQSCCTSWVCKYSTNRTYIFIIQNRFRKLKLSSLFWAANPQLFHWMERWMVTFRTNGPIPISSIHCLICELPSLLSFPT